MSLPYSSVPIAYEEGITLIAIAIAIIVIVIVIVIAMVTSN